MFWWLALAHLAAAQLSREVCAAARSGTVAFYVVTGRCPESNATLLHEAAAGGHVAVVKELLRLKALVDARDNFQMTPLAWASLKGHSAAAEILLKAEAHVDARDEFQCTALLDAAKEGHVDVARVLLEWRADVNGRGFLGRTALMEAVIGGKDDVADVLLRHSADVEAKDLQGLSPLTRARQQGNLKTVHLLLDHGANVLSNKDVVYKGPPEIQDFVDKYAHTSKLMSLPLILLAVLLGMAWDCGTWGAKRHGRDFYYGAMLLVARDGKSIFNFAGRCLEVGTVAVLIFGFGMGVMWWGFWLPLCIAAYMIPSLLDRPVTSLMKYPQLMLTTRPWLELLRTVLLLLLGTLAWWNHWGRTPSSPRPLIPALMVAMGYCVYLVMKSFAPVPEASEKPEMLAAQVQLVADTPPGTVAQGDISMGAKLLTVFVGLALDLNTVYALFSTGNSTLTLALVLLLSKCWTRQSLELGQLPEAWRESVQRGVERRDFLEVLDQDSCRAFFSISITSYSYWYCIQDAYLAALQGTSILLSLFISASFLFRRIDLDVDPQNWEA